MILTESLFPPPESSRVDGSGFISASPKSVAPNLASALNLVVEDAGYDWPQTSASLKLTRCEFSVVCLDRPRHGVCRMWES